MKYHCKYPSKLTLKGYLQKKFEEYKSSGRYSKLLDDEIKSILGFVLLDIHLILSSSKEKLLHNIDLLLKIDRLSIKEYAAIPEGEREPVNSFGALFLIMHNPAEAVDLIANNMKINFKSDRRNLYEMFLKEITPSCIKEITGVNQVKPDIRSLRFSDEVVPKSKDNPANVKQTSHIGDSMNYQYTRHKSLGNGERKGDGATKGKDPKLGESVVPAAKRQRVTY